LLALLKEKALLGAFLVHRTLLDCRGSVGSDGVGGGAIVGVDTTRRMIRERSLPRVRATVGETVWMVDPKRNLRVRGSGVSGL
jgi:hypothetical protein